MFFTPSSGTGHSTYRPGGATDLSDPSPVDKSRFPGEEQESRADPPGQPQAGPLPEHLGERVEGGIDDQDVAGKARRDPARRRQEQRPRRPGGVREPPSTRLVEPDRREEGQVGVVQEKAGVVAGVASRDSRRQAFGETPDAFQRRDSPLPRLLDPEEEPGLSREIPRAEDPGKDSRHGR